MRAAFSIAISAALALTVSWSAQAGPKLDPQLRAFLRAQFAQDDSPGFETRAAVARANLTRDGTPIVVVYLMGNSWCGSGGCTLAFVQPNGTSFRVISRTPIVELPVKVLPSRTRGWSDVAVGARGRGLAKLVFNGKRYAGNPSMSERVPKGLGTVVIPENDKGEPLSP